MKCVSFCLVLTIVVVIAQQAPAACPGPTNVTSRTQFDAYLNMRDRRVTNDDVPMALRGHGRNPSLALQNYPKQGRPPFSFPLLHLSPSPSNGD